MVAVLALGTQACTLRPLSQQATRRVDSVALSGDIAGAARANPFCLHLQHDDRFWVVYSQVSVKAWVTDGACAPTSPTSGQAGDARPVDAIDLRWLPDWHDTPRQTTCTDSAQCSTQATDVIAGRHFLGQDPGLGAGQAAAQLTPEARRRGRQQDHRQHQRGEGLACDAWHGVVVGKKSVVRNCRDNVVLAVVAAESKKSLDASNMARF